MSIAPEKAERARVLLVKGQGRDGLGEDRLTAAPKEPLARPSDADRADRLPAPVEDRGREPSFADHGLLPLDRVATLADSREHLGKRCASFTRNAASRA